MCFSVGQYLICKYIYKENVCSNNVVCCCCLYLYSSDRGKVRRWPGPVGGANWKVR